MADQPVKSLHSPEYQALIDVLTAIRQEAGLDQEELSRRVGQARMYIYKCETLRRRVDAVEVLEVSKALGLQPLDVFARWIDLLNG